ncbi:MAG: Ger(x)C family spore germination C-terminal domain-containing protein [Clostridia bacterium]
MMKRVLVFLSVLIVLTNFSACTADLYQHLIIKGFGIDKDGDQYIVSVRYASIENEEGEDVFFVTGESVYDALNKISVETGKVPLYSSASYIVCSSAVASEGLDKSLDFFVRYFKAKPVIRLFVTDGTASDILNAKKDDKLISSDVIVDSTDNSENSGKSVSATVMSFVADSKSESKSSVLPMISLQDESYKCLETAMFYDYELVDFLSEEQTNAYLTLSGNLQNASMVIEGENGEKVTTEIAVSSADINSKDGENFEINIEIKAVLVAIPFENTTESYEYLETKISEEISLLANDLLTKITENSCDILGFSNYLYKSNSTLWKEKAETFANNFNKITTSVNIKTSFVKTGEEDSGMG